LSAIFCHPAGAAEQRKPSFEGLYADTGGAIAVSSKKADDEISAVPIGNVGNTKRVPRLVDLKELLKDLPPSDRAEFIGDLRLLNGEVVSMNMAPLRRNLNSKQIDAILAGLDSPPRPASTPKRTGHPRMVDISDLLRDAPDRVRAEFYDSLVFLDGEIVSFRYRGLKDSLSKEAYADLLSALNPNPEIGPKSLCGNGWCEDSICDLPPDPEERPRCLSQEDYTCKTNCK